MPEQSTQPVSQPIASSTSAQIFTMPEQYRHGKEAKVVEPVKETKSVLAPASAAPAPPKPLSPVPPHLAKKQNHTALIVAGAIVLLALIVGGYLLLRSVQKQTPPSLQEQPAVQPVTRPAVEEEEKEAEEAGEVQEAEEISPFVAEIVPGKDSDSDGLSDVEETDLYQTNPNLPDTDADGFLDGNEVFHGYNPKGAAPGTLLEAEKVLLFGLSESMRFAYPTGWSLSEPIRFTVPTGEVITVSSIQPSLSDWVSAHGGQEQLLVTLTKSGFEMYLTPDKRLAVMSAGGMLLEFRYELGTKTTVDYLQTFQMILNSVIKTP